MGDNKQKLTIDDLPAKEQKLLKVLTNPENRQKSVTDICKLADCSRTKYYKAWKKDRFKQLVKKTAEDLVIESLLPTINAFTKKAKEGSFRHGKVVLEMAQVYKETQKHEVEGDNVINVTLEDD